MPALEAQTNKVTEGEPGAMADNLTLLELHLHAEDNEFSSDMELGSDLGSIVRDRLGFGDESEDDEQSVFGETDFGTESSGSEASADGGSTVQIGETDEDDAADETDEHGAVVEIDEAAEDDEDESGGRSKGKALLVLVLLVGFALLARRYLGGGDDFEDEFEEL